MSRSSNVHTAMKLLRASAIGATILLQGTLIEASVSAAQSQALQQITVAAQGLDTSQIQIFLAQSEGYFAREGLDAHINILGAALVPSVVAGQVDIGMTGPAAAFGPARGGKDTVLVYSYAGGGIGGPVAAGPNVKSIKDCKKVATGPTGTSIYAWANSLKRLYNVEYEVLSLNDPSTIAATVVSGAADCGAATYGPMFSAVQTGKLHWIIDVRDPSTIVSNWPRNLTEGAIWGLRSTFEQNRPTVIKFIRALDRVKVEVIDKKTPIELADLLQKSTDFQPMNRDALIANIELLQKNFLAPANGYINENLWDSSRDFYQHGGYDFLDATDPKWSYKDRVDMSYYESAIGKPK